MVTVAESGESRVGYLLNQSSDEPSLTTKGGEALLRRQLRFLVASFWRLASQVGGLVSKLPSLSINNRPEWWGRQLALQWKGGNRPFTAAPIELPFAQDDHERRQRIAQYRRTKRTNPRVLIGTIEERKRMVAPFAQGTSLENNVGDRVRTFRWLRPCCVGSSIFRYGDRSIQRSISFYRQIDLLRNGY